MAIVFDSYSESNVSSYPRLRSTSRIGYGQSFTASANGTITNCQFYLKRTGIISGNAYAKIYAHTGTYGTDSKPTGSALATSDAFDVSAVSDSAALHTLSFSGANQISLTSGTYYVLTLEYGGGDASNSLDWGCDGTSPTHSGNNSEKLAADSTWYYITGPQDFCFYLNGNEPIVTGGFMTTNSKFW